MPWKKTTQEVFWDALECLPPALMVSKGFLLGEPNDHRTCKVTGQPYQPTFAAFLGTGKWADEDQFWQHEPMTIAEFRAVKQQEVFAQ